VQILIVRFRHSTSLFLSFYYTNNYLKHLLCEPISMRVAGHRTKSDAK
jgi:hypothetical protein